jgi:transcriptional regulator with XRE-family HTH domain
MSANRATGPSPEADERPVDAHIGGRLRFLRLRAGLAQTALAERIGLTFQQLQKYEKGTNRISASKLLAFSQILDVPVQDFFEGLGGRGMPGRKATPPVLPSRHDYEIFQLAAQLGEGDVKRHVRDLLAALVAKDGKTRRRSKATRARRASD